MDATPGAYAPDRRSVGPACAPAAQVIAAGTATRLVFVKAAPYVATAEATASPASRRGSVATTPGADADGGHALCTEAPGTVPESKDSLAGRTVIPRRAGAGGYVDATPSLDAVVGAPCAHASWEWHEGENWCSGWHSSTASGSGGTWTSRPQPPKPPSPRWRPRTEDSSATCVPIAAVTAVEPEPGRTSSDMVEIEVEHRT